jgi:hypothetical protein
MIARMKMLFLVTLVCLAATACTSPRHWGETEDMPLPAGIGPETSDLKRSPCACLEVPQDFGGLKA